MEMLAGNSSAWNMVFNPTVKCPQIKPLEEVMMPSIHFSVKLELENMSLELSSLICNPPLLIKSEQEPTVNFSIPNNSSQEKKMQPIISLEDTILLEKRS